MKAAAGLKVKDTQSYFKTELRKYQTEIDADLEKFTKNWLSDVGEQFGEPARSCVESYCSILTRGGKRIRGALAMAAYGAYGGSDKDAAIKLARVLEMIHAYLLVIDDIYDRSVLRRGGPTAHIVLERVHEADNLRGDAAHYGRSQATNGALVGAHRAINELLTIDSPCTPGLVKHLNETVIATSMGQFYDMYNEVVENIDETHINNALIWKTAFYTMSNPLYMGAMLAGAPEQDLDSMSNFGLKAGISFQMSDDILCTFSDDEESGKPPTDDIREGKRTILVLKTLELAEKADALYLEQMLGSQSLSKSQFERCKSIMVESGGLAAARRILEANCEQARRIVAPSNIPKHLKNFLIGLTDFLETRKS